MGIPISAAQALILYSIPRLIDMISDSINTEPQRLNKLPGEARIWIYQSDRQLTGDEVDFLDRQAESFVDQWAAHGNDLTASWEILYNRFLILAVDENAAGASGCSIDSSVHFVQDVGKILEVDFMDRGTILYMKENDQIGAIPFQEVEDSIEEGELTPDTPIFDGTITKLEQLNSNWPRPLKDTWMGRFL